MSLTPAQAVAQLIADQVTAHAIIHGAAGTSVQTDGGLVPSFATAVQNFPALPSGTWTPGFLDDTVMGLTYANNSGVYVKVGKLVLARFLLGLSAVAHPGASALNFAITGLPFPIVLDGTGGSQDAHIGRMLGITGLTDNSPGQLFSTAFTSNRSAFRLASGVAGVNASSVTAGTRLEGTLIYLTP